MRDVHEASSVAIKAHQGQRRSNGVPYYTHPQAVAKNVRHLGLAYECVGWLHDVVEDTEVTLGDLIDKGFDQDITDAVYSLTRQDDETYAAFLRRCRGNGIARRVKIADIQHNLSDHPQNSRRDKYEVALMYLEEFPL